MKFQELSEVLMSGEFTEKELKQIKAMADIRLGNFSSKEAASKELNKNLSETSHTNLFYDRLQNVLKTECKIATMPLSVLKKRLPKLHAKVVHAANSLYATAEEWNPDKTKIRSRNFAIGVFHLYCKLVVSYLQEIKVPVSLKTSLDHVDKFVGMVDNSFPGYVDAGMIHIVILREKFA